MNTEGFTGKAQAYAAARPGYPGEAIDYIVSLVSLDAVFADVGAGTGKFTELIARTGYQMFAIEPNADMREQLVITLASFSNVKIIDSTAEATTLPDLSVDAIICSQSLGWLDLDAFRTECRRIGKPNAIIISIFNETPGEIHTLKSHRYTSRQASEVFFTNPVIRSFSNPVLYTRERWMLRSESNSNNPKAGDAGYNEHIKEMNKLFDRCSKDGILREELSTVIYSEKIEDLLC